MMTMDKRLVDWLSGGNVGTSSKSIMLWLSGRGVDKTWGPSTPSDAGDFARCLGLLEAIPEWRSRMPEMAGAGGLWPTFAKRWAEIEAVFMEESGGAIWPKDGAWPDFSRTYALMREVHDEAYAQDKPGFTEVRFDAGKLAGCSVRFDTNSKFASAFAKAAGRGK